MMLTLKIVSHKSWIKCLKSSTIVEFCHDNNKEIIMLCYSYDFGLTVRVMFGNFAKLYPPRRFIKFWQNFQTSPALLIPNCTRHRMIQGWKMFRTTGPMVPENFWVYQKIFRSKKELLARHKDKFLIGRKYIELENEKN